MKSRLSQVTHTGLFGAPKVLLEERWTKITNMTIRVYKLSFVIFVHTRSYVALLAGPIRYLIPARYPTFFWYPTRFNFENQLVSGNPKYLVISDISVIPDISCKPEHRVCPKYLEIPDISRYTVVTPGLVNCPSRWSLYTSLALCLDHLVVSGDPIYAAVFSSDHCWGLGWSFLTNFFAKYILC